MSCRLLRRVEARTVCARAAQMGPNVLTQRTLLNRIGLVTKFYSGGFVVLSFLDFRMTQVRRRCDQRALTGTNTWNAPVVGRATLIAYSVVVPSNSISCNQ